MAANVVKPLVIGADGCKREIASDETLQSADFPQVLFNEAAVPGNVVSIDAAGGVSLSDVSATAAACKKPLGIACETTAAAASGGVATDGLHTLTTAEWDAITGGAGGLTPGATYFVDPANDGQLTTTVPVGSGEYVQRVGCAINATTLNIDFSEPMRRA